MHLILCLDDRDGFSFCGKRLSVDRKLCEHVLQITSGAKLWMNAYSAKLFPDADIFVHESFLHKAEKGDYCFVEGGPLPDLDKLESITVYRWNRHYPATEKFPKAYLSAACCVERLEFPGHSHDTITMERYTS